MISSTSNYSQDGDLAVNLQGMHTDLPFGKALAVGRISRALLNYEDDADLTPLDKRLLRGFYIADRWKLVNSSEDESVKFNYKLDHNRLKGILKRTAARREDKFTIDLTVQAQGMSPE